MMFADPFRMVVEPPIAVAPDMVVIPVAVAYAPLGVDPDPFGMMMPYPAGVVFMPPGRVVPYVMVVPVTIVVRMCNDRRSRKQGCQGSGGEYCSKFHSWYLLERKAVVSGKYLTGMNTKHR